MRNVTDSLPRGSDEELAAAARANQSQFGLGMRSGAAAAMGGVNNFAGAVGDSLGLRDFAQGRYTAADQYNAEAAANAPRVASIRDVGSFGDAVDYAAGLAGGIVPVGGAALLATGLTGGGAVPAMLAGAGAMAPVEIGDVVGRQRAEGRPVNLRDAALAGGASALGQNVLPGLARARLAGAGAKIPGGSLAIIPEQAALAAGGEAAKQVGVNPEAPLDPVQIGDAAAAGGVMGVPFAGMHALGNNGAAIKAGLGKAKDAISEGATGLKERAQGALGKAADSDAAKTVASGLEDAKTKVADYDIPTKLRETWDSAKAESKAVLDRIANSEDIIGDAKAFAGATGEKLKGLLQKDDEGRFAKAQEYLNDLAKEHLDPETVEKVRTAAADLSDHANQAVVAGVKKAQDGFKAAREGISAFAEKAKTFADSTPEEKKATLKQAGETVVKGAKAVGETVKGKLKKSEDTQAIRDAITKEVMPILQKARPELFEGGTSQERTKGLNELADALRRTMEHVASGKQLDSDTIARFIDLGGRHAGDMLDAVHRAVQETDPKRTAATFREINRLADVADSHEGLMKTMQDSLDNPRLADRLSLRRTAELLDKWAGERGRADDPQVQFKDRRVREHLEELFGKNADKVIAAVEKNRKAEQNALDKARVITDDEGNIISEEGHGLTETELNGTKVQLHTAKGGLMFMHPDHDAGKGTYKPAATQRMERLKAETPHLEPRLLSASELGYDHPLVQKTRAELVRRGELAGVDGEKFADAELEKYAAVTTEHPDNPQQITGDELRGMTLDRHNHGESRSRIETGVKQGAREVVLDAVKIVRAMQGRFKDEYTTGDEASRVARMGRMFVEGIAAVQDHLGQSFEIPDSTVLGRLGGTEITWGDVRKLDTRTDADKANDKTTQTLTALRKRFRESEDGSERRILADKGRELASKQEYRKNKELAADEDRAPSDLTEFGSETQDGYALNKARMREIEAALAKIDNTTADGRDRERALLEEFGRLSLDRNTTTRAQNRNADRDSGKREIDPFGQIHEAERFRDGGDPASIKTGITGLSREAEGGAIKGKPAKSIHAKRETTKGAAEGPADGPPPEGSLERPALTARERSAVDKLASSEDFSALRTRASVDRFLDAARKRYDELKAANDADADLTDTQVKALYTLEDMFGKHATRDLQSFYDGVEGPPDPKAVAAKKAAFIEKVRSGDPELLKTLASSDDAKGLQRAAIALAREKPSPEVQRATDVVNERIAALVKADESVGYGMQTKRYSLNRADAANDDGNVLRFPDRVGARTRARVTELMESLSPEDLHTLQNDVMARDPDARLLPSMLREDFREWLRDSYSAAEREDRMTPERQGETERQFLEEMLDVKEAEPLKLAMAEAFLSGATLRKASLERTDPANSNTANLRAQVKEHIEKVLGPQVAVYWAKMPHAGEFEVTQAGDVIRLSLHSLNPMSVAYHESLHGFFAQLGRMKQGQVMEVLNRTAESAPVLNQIKAIMKERGFSEEAVRQLSNREERAAYMYQFWADGSLKVGEQTKTVLGHIADFVRSVLGMWSNDQRALHIMDYFHSGEFAKDAAKRDADRLVRARTMEPGRNQAVEQARKMTSSLREMGEALFTAGGQRLRDTGIPALRELADTMKLHGVAEGEDAGFVPAARAERARAMNKLATDLRGMAPEAIDAARAALQSKSDAAINALAKPEDRLAARAAKKVLRDTLDRQYQYMKEAGVKVGDLGVGKDYFPRVYDTSYISSHTAEFKAVLTKHGVKDPEGTLRRIMTADGNEFTVETDKPGMQHLKMRELAFIPDAELAPFMRQDTLHIMSSYITQATRRAEWARRLGDNSERLTTLFDEARQQGATDAQIETANKFIRGVDGTLGDTISPEARRLFGNMIVYQNIRLLPLAIFSSVVDPLGIAVRGGTVRDSFNAFKRGVVEIKKNFQKNPTSDDATKFAADIGVIDDAMLTHTLGALYSQGMVGDTGRKINDAFFRFNLMEQFNVSQRVAATEAAMGFLSRHANGDASPHSVRWLNELGLQKGDVQLDGNGRVKVLESDGLTAEHSAKMKMALNRWVDGAVLRPDSVDKPIWFNDPHFALFSHLKQFVYSFHETILKRVAHEYQHGNYAPAMALASYVPMMIAADMAKGLIQGGGSQPSWKEDWDTLDYIESGVERAGIYGTGQFAIDAIKDVHRGGSGIGALVGPTVEQLADAVRVVGGREQFGDFAVKSMPANALYASALKTDATDPKFVD